MTKSLTLLLTVLALTPAGFASARPVQNPQAACAVATTRVAALRHLSTSHVATCEASLDAEIPGYYIVSLHGHCFEEICGSTLMGWFVVRKADSAVFELDVGEWKVGRPVDSRS